MKVETKSSKGSALLVPLVCGVVVFATRKPKKRVPLDTLTLQPGLELKPNWLPVTPQKAEYPPR